MNTKNELSVRRQCQLLRINRSSLYYDPREADEEAIRLKEEIMNRIDYWHTTMPYIGSRKIALQLRKEGYRIGRKLARRYMREMTIYAVYPKPNTSKRNNKEPVVPYLLRNKVVICPNQVWSIDITYIKMSHSHMYLTAVIDWYTRMIVGWKLSDTLDLAPVLAAVKEAIGVYGTPAILNSDQGSHFTSNDYKALLREYRIQQSMDGKSRWADNIMIERWFRSLKTECIYINEYESPNQLRKLITSYVKEYNTVRPHDSLEGATPEEVYTRSFQTLVA